MLESALKRLFLAELPKMLPDLRLINRVVGNFEASGGPGQPNRSVNVGIKGLPDLHGWRRGGAAVEVELKAATGRMRPEQERFRAWCQQWGIQHYVLQARKDETPEQTVSRWIEEIRDVRA